MSEADTLKRILVLDDDEDQRNLLLMYLGKMFTHVEIEQYDPVASGAPPENFNWSRFDVLILDYYLCLHGVTGLDIVHSNRNNPDFPATIMLTGAGNEEIAMRAMKAGVYDYLRKQSLDKLELRNSILSAFEKHKQARKNRGELTQQGAAFNKSLFYQKLEYKNTDKEFRNRVLCLIELNNHAAIEETVGMILRDNIVRHIARQSYEVFKLGECNPTAIRLGDYSIALLIDAPESRKTLEFNINGLINHLKKRPYKFGENKFKFTISLGVVPLLGQGDSADTILNYAKAACEVAAEAEDNAYHIHEFDIKPESGSSAITESQTDSGFDIDLLPEPVSVPSPSPASESVASLTPVIPDNQPVPANNPAEQVVAHKDLEPPKQITTPKVELAPPKDKPKDITVPATKQTPTQPVPAPTVNTIKEQNTAATAAPAQKSQPSSAAKPAVQPPPAQTSIATDTPEKTRPQKSLAELKASATQVKPALAEKPAAAVPPAAAKPVDPELNVADLDDAGRNLKQAFDEKRVIQLFQPVISLMNEDESSEDEIHRVSMQLIEKDGTIKPAAEIKSSIVLPAFRKFVDRWLLREIIGRLANSSNNKHSFIVDISDASLSDANFFNWLRKLLTGLDSKSPGKHIILEIDVKHLITLEKQANALITFLRKSHEFKFMLGNIDTITEIIQFSSKIKFDFVRCNIKLINELAAMVATDKTKGNSQLELIKSDGSRFIADDIINATALTEGITAGAEYAMGEFIGEPATQLDDITNFETFEII